LVRKQTAPRAAHDKRGHTSGHRTPQPGGATRHSR